jgi:hypothetical protein
VYNNIDVVRERAGLDGVQASWSAHSTNPSKPNTKEGLREIIHQERLIELAFEGHRFWDLRRWLKAHIYLNNSNAILQKQQLSKGGITGTLVDVRLTLKMALELGATALILVHNHPSGTLKPSVADKQITQKLKTAASSLDIKVLDHVIITEHSYFSFADENEM